MVMRIGFTSVSKLPVIAVVALAVYLGSCTSTPKKSLRGGPLAPGAAVSGPVTREQTKEFQEIQTLFNKSVFETAQARCAQFLRKFPKSGHVPAVENIYGLTYLFSKRPQQAILHFKRSIDTNPSNTGFNQYVLFNLATAQFDANLVDEAQQTATEIRLEYLDRENKLKTHYLRARIYEKKNNPREAAREVLAASRLMPDADSKEARAPLAKSLEQALQSISDISTLESLYNDYQDSPLGDVLLFRLGSQELALGNRGGGEAHMRTLRERYPQSPYYSQAGEMLATTSSQGVVEGRAIGVLLPMKGKYAKFGQRSLNGIQLATRIFELNEPASPVTLIVEDSGEEPDQAIKALNRLVFKHHVAAVIGPLLSKGIEQVSQRAQELGVPMLSLARNAVNNTDYVFQGGLTLQLQAEEVARFAIEKLKLKRFAMVYPNDKSGEEMSQRFWNAVESLGGKVVGAETYAPGETDFRQAVDRLSGLHYTEARQRELEILARERETNNIRRRTRKTEKFFNLQPIIDYDAVFVPDEPKVAGQVIPTFAYRDVEGVKFLGPQTWNSQDFLVRVQAYADHAFFPDAFVAESGSARAKSYAEKFKTQFGQEATAMDALAYDAALLLESVLSSTSESVNRADVRDRLKAVNNFQGVTGKISYKDGYLMRDLKILSVKSNKIVEVE